MIAELASAFRAGVLAQQSSRTQLAPRAVGVGGLARRLPARGDEHVSGEGRADTRIPWRGYRRWRPPRRCLCPATSSGGLVAGVAAPHGSSGPPTWARTAATRPSRSRAALRRATPFRRRAVAASSSPPAPSGVNPGGATPRRPTPWSAFVGASRRRLPCYARSGGSARRCASDSRRLAFGESQVRTGAVSETCSRVDAFSPSGA